MLDARGQETYLNPLLSRFMGGEDYQHRPVRISDSGRIRNELQTLCSEALEFPQQDHIRVHFDRIPAEVISTNWARVRIASIDSQPQ